MDVVPTSGKTGPTRPVSLDFPVTDLKYYFKEFKLDRKEIMREKVFSGKTLARFPR